MKDVYGILIGGMLEQLFSLVVGCIGASIFLAIVFALKVSWLFKWTIILNLVSVGIVTIHGMISALTETDNFNDSTGARVIKLIFGLYIMLMVLNIMWNYTNSYLTPLDDSQIKNMMGNWSFFWPTLLGLWMRILGMIVLSDIYILMIPVLVIYKPFVTVIIAIVLTVILAGMGAAYLGGALSNSPSFGNIVRQFVSQYLTFGLLSPVA